MSPTLVPGMYVRIPLEDSRADGHYREFGIGWVCSVDALAATVRVHYRTQNVDTIEENERDFLLADVTRCRILPNSPFYHADSDEPGTVLLACSDTDGVDAASTEPWWYYVRFRGTTARLPETVLRVLADTQDPDPVTQLRRYELHNPIWREQRNGIVASYAELRNATFGIEDLVGARVALLAHQADVIARVLADPLCRFMLADEVGLGKTVEACVILKGLRRRHPGLRCLIVAPRALVQQWRNELDAKFWLTFPILTDEVQARRDDRDDSPGAIVSAEDLDASESLWAAIRDESWGLVIVDEAHRARTAPALEARLRYLSSTCPCILVLTATPIQRRSTEYLALLALMDPARYGSMPIERFAKVLAAQGGVGRVVPSLAEALDNGWHDAREFVERLTEIPYLAANDTTINDALNTVAAQADRPGGGAKVARELLAYIGENYRIEQRVIRNRRADVEAILPTRTLNAAYQYDPGLLERETLAALAEYVVAVMDDDAAPLESLQESMYAAASSPHALLAVLSHASVHPRLTGVVALTERWREETDTALAEARARNLSIGTNAPHRLVRVLQALYDRDRTGARAKLLIFSSWPATLDALLPHLHAVFAGDAVAQFRAGRDALSLQEAADRFQDDPQCRILLCDETGGEGRNFQNADAIIHIDLPWTPARIEQRIGRVDRLGRGGEVPSVVVTARDTLEHDLFRIWHEAFHLFTESLSGMEIALEGVQDELTAAFREGVRDGFAAIFESLCARAEELRAAVEEERYFARPAALMRRSASFTTVSEQYRDGSLLRDPLLRWTDLAGLRPIMEDGGSIVTFDPRRFNPTSMKNAQLHTLPPMHDALRRSGNRRALVVRGTFDRDIAVRRESLVFFAPGSDPWTDALFANALRADRGRCCGIMRRTAAVKKRWRGLELLYTLQVNPEPLFAAGFDAAHLFRAQGYLNIPTYTVLVSETGEIVDPMHPIAKATRERFDKSHEWHLGKRDGDDANLRSFIQAIPQAQWEPLLEHMLAAATRKVREEFDFLDDEADDAEAVFTQHTAGQRAARRFLGTSDLADTGEMDEADAITSALVAGIRSPLIRLESACFWILVPPK